jgi:EAL domain-containing protein (putative c-di-GMP-specific phosphodiesterase class I)
MVADALTASGLPAARLVISFAEETLLTGSVALVPELEALRGTGVRLCLDGYGTGHSLFGLLARVPLDLVRSHLTTLAPRDGRIEPLQVLEGITRITAGLGLTVVAGGISSPELRDSAFAIGVDLVHGRSLPHGLDRAALAALLAITPAPAPTA